MIRAFFAIVCGLLAAALIASPALARQTPRPTPVGIWVDLHFVDAGGKAHLIVVPLSLFRASQVETECGDAKGLAVLAKGAALDDPRVASMKLASASCERDGNGQVKTAIGKWPKGKGPGYTEEPGFSINVQGDALKGAPAVVVLHFVATNGRHVNTVIGYATKATYYMSTCAAALPPQVPSLVRLAATDREATAAPGDNPPYSFKGLKLIAAECVPPPKMLGDLGWPKASVELATPIPDFR